MKHLISTFLSLYLFCSCSSATSEKPTVNAKVDEKKGYKDFPLDAPFKYINLKTELISLKEGDCPSIQKFIVEQGKYLKIGEIEFDQVKMTFANDSLSSTTLFKTFDQQAFENLKTIYFGELGQPSETESRKLGNTQLHTFTWQGNNIRIHMDATESGAIIIDYSSAAGSSREFDQSEKCKQENIKKGKSEI